MHVVSYDCVGFRSGKKIEKLTIFNNADIKNREEAQFTGFYSLFSGAMHQNVCQIKQKSLRG